jgi:hypothetical protein
VGSVVFSSVVLANSLELRGPAAPGFYLAGLGWLLFFSTSLLVRLVLAFGGDRTADNPSPNEAMKREVE